MVICQGLKAMEKAEFESAISFFAKAAQKQTKKRDPYLLRALSVVLFAQTK